MRLKEKEPGGGGRSCNEWSGNGDGQDRQGADTGRGASSSRMKCISYYGHGFRRSRGQGLWAGTCMNGVPWWCAYKKECKKVARQDWNLVG